MSYREFETYSTSCMKDPYYMLKLSHPSIVRYDSTLEASLLVPWTVLTQSLLYD